jgi:hypothetical protein
MLDAKQAILTAKQKAAEMLDQPPAKLSLEEIERESYKGRDVWFITLGFPRDLGPADSYWRITADPLQYKVLLIDAETGDLVAMKLREPASQ